jgi:predicted AlkP superfamily phosphohydrolase/phosphomutase/tetratricopeptide (TPR) repeat protein
MIHPQASPPATHGILSTAAATSRKVLLIGWDSADWKIINPLLAEGGMDGIRSLMDGGIHGNLATLEPQLSPMLWSSIATGKMAYHHQVPGFTEVDPISGQVVAVSAATRQCKTIWEMLGEKGLRSHVVSWFATQGEQNLNGKMVSNMFPHVKGTAADTDPADFPPPMPGTYWPEDLAETMNELRVSPHEIDEEILQPFLPQGHLIDQARDKRLHPLREHMAEAYSVQSAATHLMQTDPDWDFMAIYFRAIDEISHHFMHYHPPQMAGIPDEDFEIYQHVVKSTYRAHDMMLQVLLQMAGPDTTVILVSDHGFHSDHLRPQFTPRVPAGITVWHREQGVLLAKGPGIKKATQPIYGARLLDITPTILHAFGHPVGDDMEGRVLKELFAADRPIATIPTIPTWENPDGPSQKRGSLSAEESAALLQQFVDLGYIDEVSSDPTEAAAGTNRENKWNLARAYLYSGKYDGALSLLEDCFHANPERTDYAQTLARTQLHLGLAGEAEETLAICLETFGNNASAQLLQASIALEKGDHPQALDLATTIRQQNPDHPQILTILCRSYTALENWDEALSCAENLQQLDPDNYQARITRARHALHHLQDAAAAADLALEAIALHFGDFRAHAILGQALLQQNQLREAEHTLLNALRLNKHHAPATHALVQTYRALGEKDKANGAEAYAIHLKASEAAESRKKLESLRTGIAARARTRHAERQRQREETARQQAEEDAISPSTFTIVSGLPRSGTSLMMQMLTAAGMEAMTDGKRPADEDNLQGYFEWEDIKSLRKNPRLIEQAKGKVIKVISALIPQLPPKHRYRILFMKRPISEIVDSQWAMLARNGKKPRSEKDHLIQTQQTHLDQTLAQLRQRKNVELLEIDYPALVATPDAQLPALRDFLGDTAPQPENLTTPIRPELHRNK